MLERLRPAVAWIVTLMLLCAAGPASKPDAAQQEATFEQLKTLVGVWRGQSPSGRVLEVSYELVANNTVLVETWTLAPGRRALTLYHMDGEKLIATHYCPIGNQPRLELRRTGHRHEFEFTSATNLQSPTQAHQHSFWIELRGAEIFVRSETYRENGADEVETTTFTRVAEPA